MTSGWRLSGMAVMAGVCLLTLPMLAPGSNDNEDKDVKPNGKGIGSLLNPGEGNSNGGEAKAAKPGGGGTSNGINYHGGPVMLGTVNVYYIWYGDWSGNSATSVLTDLASNIGGSPYFNINTTYYNGSNTHV